MKMLLALSLTFTMALSSYAESQQCHYSKQKVTERFMSCENCAGGGFFWVDTTCGKVWWARPADAKWVYYGEADGSKKGMAGRYIPHKNKSGGGLFILNTVTGEGWWTNGSEWKKMGVPKK